MCLLMLFTVFISTVNICKHLYIQNLLLYYDFLYIVVYSMIFEAFLRRVGTGLSRSEACISLFEEINNSIFISLVLMKVIS